MPSDIIVIDSLLLKKSKVAAPSIVSEPSGLIVTLFNDDVFLIFKVFPVHNAAANRLSVMSLLEVSRTCKESVNT